MTERARVEARSEAASRAAIALFETAIGACGIAWGERGLLAVALPAARDGLTRARLRRRVPGAPERAPDADVRAAIDGIVSVLGGGRDDLSTVELDLEDLGPFDRRVYEGARMIEPGETLTYGELAARIGVAGEAREVGRALASNPFPVIVPCHRVVAAGGRLGGFSAPGGAQTKRRLLAIERRHASVPPALF